jgi:class 3 adenylate cyclase
MRRAFARWHGREMGTEGDSFFVVFTSVGDAVCAVLQAQRDLARQLAGGERVRLRMGLHTGEPVRHEDGYIGSTSTSRRGSRPSPRRSGRADRGAQRSERHPQPDVSMLDLGRHRLKDIPEPVHLYQLVADGLDRDLPAGAQPRRA